MIFLRYPRATLDNPARPLLMWRKVKRGLAVFQGARGAEPHESGNTGIQQKRPVDKLLHIQLGFPKRLEDSKKIAAHGYVWIFDYVESDRANPLNSSLIGERINTSQIVPYVCPRKPCGVSRFDDLRELLPALIGFL